jgi:hypothetical protein
MTQSKDEEYKLSHKDIQIYARQLCAIAVQEHLAAGRFDLDIAKFGENEQLRIRKELKSLIQKFNNVDGKELPPEKPGRPRKEKEEKGQE